MVWHANFSGRARMAGNQDQDKCQPAKLRRVTNALNTKNSMQNTVLRLSRTSVAREAAPPVAAPPVVRLLSTVWPNPSFKPSPNGGPPGPGHRYGVHCLWPGPGVLPSVPA